MPDIYDLATEFKARAAANELQAAQELVQAYGAAYRAIADKLDGLMADVKDWRREHGKKPVPKSWIYRQERYKELLEQCRSELRKFGAFATGRVTSAQAASVMVAAQDAAILLGAGSTLTASLTTTFNTLPSEAIQNLVGFAGDGSPLKALFDAIPGEVTSRLRNTLVSSLAAGLGARETARNVRRASGVGLTRALTISRTEVLRSYREATLDTYRANSDVVEGWQWLASRSVRTCPVCLAMDGKRFPLAKHFGSHPNCRCTTIPILEDNSDTTPRQSASEWFASQPEGVQEGILGPAKFALYRDGRITLDDLVGERDDPQWGVVRFEKSLQDVQDA